MKKTGFFRLALVISLIMAISLVFLYLLERQKIYSSIKESSRNLVSQEKRFYEQLSLDWDKSLMRIRNDRILGTFLAEYENRSGRLTPDSVDPVKRLFGDLTSYHRNYIHRVSLIAASGKEIVAVSSNSNDMGVRNWETTDFFINAITNQPNEPVSTHFIAEEKDTLLVKSVAVKNGNKSPVLLAFSVRVSDLIKKYQYLLAANISDQVIATRSNGNVIFSLREEAVVSGELKSVLETVKQNSSDDPIVEYGLNIWSVLPNDAQDMMILFLSKGERITEVLNDEYKKLGLVFFSSSFILILLVFFSTRKMQRQALRKESDKVLHQQRSHNFASISDEIRQPLNALMGSLVTLEETTSKEFNPVYLGSAKKSAQQILELVNEFTDFANINQGKFQLQAIDFDLRTTLNDIADLMSVQAEEKGLDISCLVSSDMPKRVKGDASRLRQVLINLIGFAIKYTDQGEISLCLSMDDLGNGLKRIHIDVSDTGNIIDQERMLEHFTMFTDPNYYNDEDYSGEGLPLALSKALITLMEGDITVKENNSGGNTFRVSLPMPVVEVVAAQSVKDNLKGKRVLVVGEIESNRQMLTDALSRWGMSGGTMNDFAQVPRILSESRKNGKQYDACIIDISLSSLSEKAFALVKDIRKELDDASLGIIVLTVQGAPGDAAMAKELGVQAYLTKPLARKDMKEVLKRILDVRLDKPAEFVTRHTLKEGEQASLSRVLIAESEESSQKQLIRFFENSRYQVDLARDGKALEEAIANNIYDIAFIELELPKADAMQIVRKFRKEEKSTSTGLNLSGDVPVKLPIIGLTKKLTPELIKRCESFGWDNVAAKPIRPEEMESIITTHLTQ